MARAGRINHADLSLAIRGWISQPPPPARFGRASVTCLANTTAADIIRLTGNGEVEHHTTPEQRAQNAAHDRIIREARRIWREAHATAAEAAKAGG